MTVQRDRHGRWVPIKGERTTNIQKAREERRSFHVGESKEHVSLPIALAEASPLHGLFSSVEGTPTRYPGTTCLTKSKRSFRKRSKTQADVIRDKQRDRVISSRIVLRWKETDIGCKAKARWCVHGFPGS